VKDNHKLLQAVSELQERVLELEALRGINIVPAEGE
jgi:hypothetical protein